MNRSEKVARRVVEMLDSIERDESLFFPCDSRDAREHRAREDKIERSKVLREVLGMPALRYGGRDWECGGFPCKHKLWRRGNDVPRRHGSYRCEVCLSCGARRFTSHVLSMPSLRYESLSKWKLDHDAPSPAFHDEDDE